MKLTSKEVLENISNHCAHQLTHYKFNTSTLHVGDKYREGRLTGLKYIGELSYYYLQEETKLQHYFHQQIIKQIESYSCMPESEYKKGMYDALNETLDQINEWKHT